MSSEPVSPLSKQSDPVALAAELIRCPSVTPVEGGALDLIQRWLEPLGFACERLIFADEGLPPVDNLYARLGAGAPHFCFAGHTDVVPAGSEEAWSVPPFQPAVVDGMLTGRGAADMKGAIAAFLAAMARYVDDAKFKGSISLLITGDEEGMAINGTRKLVTWLQEKGETIDHCIVGEPSNPDTMGDMIKVGRRGSFNAQLTVHGIQGHVAYPHRADNPVPKLNALLAALTGEPLDDGYERFQPSNLEVTALSTPPLAENVIPGEAGARFNVRFNPNWTGASLEAHLRERLEKAAANYDGGIEWELSARTSGEAFLTTDTAYTDLLADCVEQHTGRRPELSTSGGTSDARFIKDIAPVAEFGLVGATMHKVNEQVATGDIHLLTAIYHTILTRYFDAS
ncbi:succinyl-diaminopimelate desuccinylase [Parvularcula flava]|uniref:Succinyl-diaminopimelate desuccinylase n=1 Tax=Aquisalinus luteolus TaxID=1566827 RepID=A0A8J3A417_9PROT|nr:succinyl-diaminopimelate desuccinylase [Aquisalinus luteolus]NHK28425.1 succinyl-diaminopimelate desuccinylase [Aquisalinus luteolus]GGH98435.1 succinyl-diaminopimelate desuccinylase [Aquisalinus luteolus]